ncbi:tetratricopeptide repeat protein [Lyngbya confervoides]|uniref:Tetratricopeptide repeat protein n=1 Tax=Lyngbya confervoides BDU141951 TaxID=1574623 RepID=A0ABD4T841_9CYAN|nr:tetratricopeptide repeat protein [Lyngbya confervoides]MCM1984675.1 tetratricopeptide repeat protein [Lyngbya confervoides BDU141951]
MNRLQQSLSTATTVLVLSALAVGSNLKAVLAASPPSWLQASLNRAEYDALVLPPPVTAEDFYNRGLFFHGEDDLEEALDQFSQAIVLDPDNPDYYFSLGLTYSDLGDHKLARRNYSQAIALDSTFAAAYYQRGLSRLVIPIAQVNQPAAPSLSADQRQNLTLAIQDFSRAIDLSPAFVAAHYHRGLSYYLQGNETLARQDYQKAKQLNPLIAEHYYQQGFSRLYIGGDPSRGLP